MQTAPFGLLPAQGHPVSQAIWLGRGGRVAEGAPLLRAYTFTRIEGSNPFLSASQFPENQRG